MAKSSRDQQSQSQPSTKFDQFPRQMAELASMGFTNEKVNMDALVQSKGNMELAVDIVIKKMSNPEMNQPTKRAQTVKKTNEMPANMMAKLVEHGFTDVVMNQQAWVRSSENFSTAIKMLEEHQNSVLRQQQAIQQATQAANQQQAQQNQFGQFGQQAQQGQFDQFAQQNQTQQAQQLQYQQIQLQQQRDALQAQQQAAMQSQQQAAQKAQQQAAHLQMMNAQQQQKQSTANNDLFDLFSSPPQQQQATNQFGAQQFGQQAQQQQQPAFNPFDMNSGQNAMTAPTQQQANPFSFAGATSQPFAQQNAMPKQPDMFSQFESTNNATNAFAPHR